MTLRRFSKIQMSARCEPDGFTSDNVPDVKTLELNPQFGREMEHAMVNDEDRPSTCKLLNFFVDSSVAEIAKR